jgi:hypothetical protein
MDLINLDYSGKCYLEFVNELRRVPLRDEPFRHLYDIGLKFDRYNKAENPTSKTDGIYEVLIVRAENNLEAIEDTFPIEKRNFPLLEAIVKKAKAEVEKYRTAKEPELISK